MNICVLDAAPQRNGAAAAARRAITEFCGNRGATLQTFFLPDIPIADCAGDFKCWTHTPGECAINDANRDIARAVMQSDVLAFLTPVTFGGYSAELKKAIDHLIPNISPFFTTVSGETHHQKRYERYPAIVGVGLLDAQDEGAERVFRAIVARNAINMQPERHAVGVVHGGLDAESIAAEVTRLMESGCGTGREATAPSPSDAPRVHETGEIDFGPVGEETRATAAAPRSALLLGGSPRGEQSSSTVLGRYLLAQLAGRGLSTESLQIYGAQRSAAGVDGLLAATDRADLIVVSFPLYVDSLPAGVIRMLERIAAHRRAVGAAKIERASGPQRLAAIVQCGFPEARHNHTALAVCRQFALETGFVWTGGLPLGGGHGLVQSKPLESLGGKAAFVRSALALAATALAAGKPVPEEAVALMSKPFAPAWLYRLFGNLGWRLEARRSRPARSLRDRPYAPRT